MNAKFIKIIIIGLISATIFGCKIESANNANAGNMNSMASGVEVNKNKTENAVVNKNSNANTKPVTDNSPKRISFNKGANWGAVNITLAPGAVQKFVVSARSGQTMQVESSSKETSINLIKGKADTTEDFGFLTAVLESNGDYVFEVRNGTKKEIKTSVKVTIEGEEQYQRGVLSDVEENEETNKQ